MKAIKGITINGELHTARDLDMIFKKNECIAENPEPKRLTESIQGRSGVVDYSDYYDGIIFFENRTVSYKFFFGGTPAEVNRAIEKLNRYHGRQITVVEDDDPFYSLRGLASVSVDERAPYGNYVYMTLSLDAEPYRWRTEPTILRESSVSGTKYIEVENDVAPVNLTIKINSLVPNTTPDFSTYAVRVSTDSTSYSEVVQTVGSEVTITSFLMKGGAQKIKLETVKLISNTSWNVVSSATADVIIKYTEGKF
ncbi:hypothetical protein [Ruminococcus sp.]|uniref:hypothetical protein n=1 Tax=Ruminococcus sp. TaxID=41978 RepID=UPI002E780B2E|nr:hypothetical protein [Ruminococcus sp.]MEE1263509.1 hypothetical protein [Ruminococcus sp.]